MCLFGFISYLNYTGRANNQQRHGEADGRAVHGQGAGRVDQAGIPKPARPRRLVLRPLPAAYGARELVRGL